MLTVLAALALFFSMATVCNVLGEIYDNALWFLLAIPCTILLMAEGQNPFFSAFGYILIGYDFLRICRYIYLAVSPNND